MVSILSKRQLQRYRTLVGVATKYGFGHLVDRFNLHPLQSVTDRVTKTQAVHPELSDPKRIRMMFEELGPTYIKLGQILSTKEDLLPKEYLKELEKLQDDVPPFGYDDVCNIVAVEFGTPIDEMFETFSREPIASVSLGQAHIGKPDRCCIHRRRRTDHTLARGTSYIRYSADRQHRVYDRGHSRYMARLFPGKTTVMRVICAATYLCFISSEEIIGFLGQGGLNVITRLMGLILATIGTGRFLAGVDAEIVIFLKQLVMSLYFLLPKLSFIIVDDHNSYFSGFSLISF